MRILFVSNMFPPYARGGYEQWCEEVALALAARGHELAVLTARTGLPRVPGAVDDGDTAKPLAVYRLLHQQVEGSLADTIVRLIRSPQRFEAANRAAVRWVLEDFQPQAALVWGMWNIDRSVPHLLEACLGPHIAYYFCDYWPSLPNAYVQRMQEPARRAQMQQVKALVGRYFLPRLVQTEALPLRFAHPICVSRAVRDILLARGVDIAHAKVVYGGTAVDEFVPRPCGSTETRTTGLRLLYVGRLDRTKGVHTLVCAMRSVAADIALDIVGTGEPAYVAELQGLIAELSVGDRVSLQGAVPRVQVPHVLAQHDVLVFPSEWEEPFARTVLEAMAAGLPVIGTTTGGTGELLVEGKTGLTYTAGDVEQLAAQIRRLAGEPALRAQLALTARRTVEQYYTIGRMVDELEAELIALAAEPALISC